METLAPQAMHIEEPVDFTSAFPNRSDEQQVVQNQGEMIIATDI
jgi:hypothetical protein